MGRQSLPDISKVEDVLELITNQEKYKIYMQEILTASKAAQEVLGNLAVKDKADAYLRDAQTKLAEADAISLKVTQESSVTLKNVSVAEAELKQKQDAFNEDVDATNATLQKDAEGVAQLRANFDALYASKTAELDARVLDINDRSERLRVAEEENAAQKLKITQALSALG